MQALSQLSYTPENCSADNLENSGDLRKRENEEKISEEFLKSSPAGDQDQMAF